MKYVRVRTTLALAIAVPLWIILATGCASPRGVPLYDGDDVTNLVTSPDSALYVRVHIENHRTVDAIAPTIYLTGSGRHSLGRIEGMGGKIDRLVDTAWFGADNCLQISAHYAGGRDLTFDRICWRKGERIIADLDNVFSPIAAWSSR